MERIGLDADALMVPLNITRSQLHSMPVEKGLPASYYSKMYREAVGQMESLQRPIPWAAGLGSEAFALMCHIFLTGTTLGVGLHLAQRFDDLVYPMIGYRVTLEQSGSQAFLNYHVRTGADDSTFVPADWERAASYETVAQASGLLVWYALSGWFIGRSIALERVEIAGEFVSTEYRVRLEKVFQCPIEFSAANNRLVFARSDLEHRIVHTLQSLEQFLDNAVFQLIAAASKPASTAAAIRSLIQRDFLEGMPSFEKMASNLHMSESSLRRRLQKEGSSYQQIKDTVRCEFAIEHLRDETIRINTLAGMLGFAEPSSFVRSFRSWTGLTPKAYRTDMIALAGS
ncbi:MAG: AraC-like DNA-binding protein [Halieaceae bacterium]|jgi:AraC-like DNA-binding protein